MDRFVIRSASPVTVTDSHPSRGNITRADVTRAYFTRADVGPEYFTSAEVVHKVLHKGGSLKKYFTRAEV